MPALSVSQQGKLHRLQMWYFHAGGWPLLFGIDLFLWKLQAEARLPVDELAAPRLIARAFVLVAC